MSEPSDIKKRPASQYYWGDWHKDLALQSCPLPARGLWHEMNCLMHQGDPYGHLTINGRAMTPAQLANLAKITDKECRKLLQLLEDAGVFSRTEAGTIFSRRMVRDESARNARAEGGKLGAEHGSKGAAHGSKGGRPSGEEGGKKTPLDQNKEPPLYPPPSSSSSSSSSNNTPLPPAGGADRFGEFWALWPKSNRKGAKAKCEELWRKAKLDAQAETILAHVRAMAATADWQKQNGEYIPAPVVYLRGKRWDGAEVSERTESTFAGVV